MSLRPAFSIRNKIIVIILSVSILTLLLGFSFVIWFDVGHFRDDMVHRSRTLTEIVAEYSVSELVFNDRDSAQETLSKLAEIPELEAAVLYDTRGRLFASFVRSQAPPPELPFETPGYRIQGKALHVVDRVMLDDEKVGVIYLRSSTKILDEKIAGYLRAMMLLTLALIVAALLAAASMQGVISNPILKLAEVARGVEAQGDYSVRVIRKGDDEVGELYDAWNGMLSQIEARQREQQEIEEALRRSEARFRSIIENSSDPMYVMSPDNVFYYVNPRFEEVLEVNAEEATTAGFDNLNLVAPESRDFVKNKRASLYNGDATGQRFEFQCITASEKTYTFEVNKTPIEWDRKEAYLGILRDITRRLEVEEKLREQQKQLRLHTEKLEHYAAELERSNRELDQFAYVVSHDLRAPLRAISNLSSWIEDDLKDLVPEETAQHLELLRRRAGRLENLITGILEYSRVGRVRGEIVTVDVDQLLQDIIGDLAPPPGISVTVEPGMPELKTDRIRLAQVFSNLINNAIKHHPGTSGSVRIAVAERPVEYEFSVSDDGAGIAPEYHERIFTIFQTLQPRDKHETTGVGLAIVKKIIDEKKGRIWVESDAGNGATFKFTWPLEGNHEDQETADSPG